MLIKKKKRVWKHCKMRFKANHLRFLTALIFQAPRTAARSIGSFVLDVICFQLAGAKMATEMLQCALPGMRSVLGKLMETAGHCFQLCVVQNTLQLRQHNCCVFFLKLSTRQNISRFKLILGRRTSHRGTSRVSFWCF